VTPADADAAAHIFVPSAEELAEQFVVDGPEGHHLERVRRLRVGERVTAADGAGAWRAYEIVAAASGCVTLEARGPAQHDPAPAVRVALAIAVTKGGIDDVATACTELGVDRIIPVRTARGVVRWNAAKANAATERLRKVVREAAMQSRRAHLPSIDALADFADIAARPDLVVADRSGVPAADLTRPRSGEWTVLIGPEGGLTPEELATVGAAPRLALGTHVLRATTAPVAAVAVLVAAVAHG
jgi:16S rRNA (uracil1498-N3)-methyltransferase